jgi:hypothetical protein
MRSRAVQARAEDRRTPTVPSTGYHATAWWTEPFLAEKTVPYTRVLGRTPVSWGSNRTLADLLGEPAAFHAFAPSWQPLFWNLADQTAEGLLASGEAWLQTLAVIRAQGEEAAAFAAGSRGVGCRCLREVGGSEVGGSGVVVYDTRRLRFLLHGLVVAFS